MKAKYQFYRNHVDNKFKRKLLIKHAIILWMFGTVLHDSFVHGLPFYFILFAIAGAIVGIVYRYTTKVRFDEDGETIREEGGIAGIVVAAIVLSTRFFAGGWVLEEFHVIHNADALYLFFIGMHYSQIKSTTKQIDELVYQNTNKKKREP